MGPVMRRKLSAKVASVGTRTQLYVEEELDWLFRTQLEQAGTPP